MFTNDLRKASIGNQLPWTKQEILAGLNYFKKLYGRYPTSQEIDKFEYLPSARSIQRSHNGLVNLRKTLLPAEVADFTRGSERSLVASKTYSNSREYEHKFYNYLVTQFADIAVHEHKVIRPGQVNCDFYIYLSENIGVVVDIFYAESMINLVNIVNIKLKRYVLVEQETYLVVVGNPNIIEEDLVVKMANKRIPLPSNISIITEETFKNSVIKSLRSRSIFKR